MSNARVAAVSRPIAQRPRRARVTCDCGDVREVSYENAKRIEKGYQSRLCGPCLRGEPPTREVTEAHLSFWLVDVGRVPAAMVQQLTASGYVERYGLPAAVSEIASTVLFWPPGL